MRIADATYQNVVRRCLRRCLACEHRLAASFFEQLVHLQEEGRGDAHIGVTRQCLLWVDELALYFEDGVALSLFLFR